MGNLGGKMDLQDLFDKIAQSSFQNEQQEALEQRYTYLDKLYSNIKDEKLHIDDFIKYGELLDFCFYITEQQNGKKKTCKREIISPDDERAKKCVEHTKQELLRPYSYETIKREFYSLKTQHHYDYLNRFYEEYRGKQLEPEAQNFFDDVCKELIEKEN